jgi:Xaa-Pro aminopeptidase
MGYPPEEFGARRQRLANALQRGTLVMFGAATASPGLRFRQDHDFFYLTGNESPNATLVMDGATGESHLFLPKLTTGEIRYEGANWLEVQDAARTRGFASIQPLQSLEGFLSRRRDGAGAKTLWTRLSERDTINNGRDDTALAILRRRVNPLAQYPTEDALRVASLRERFPQHEVLDVTPSLDPLRLLKTPREIDILRYNGRISAEAMRRAIQATAPGRFEYELEAEATHWMFKHGLQAAAYPAIVASGPMGNQWHYEDNGRQMSAGDWLWDAIVNVPASRPVPPGPWSLANTETAVPAVAATVSVGPSGSSTFMVDWISACVRATVQKRNSSSAPLR